MPTYANIKWDMHGLATCMQSPKTAGLETGKGHTQIVSTWEAVSLFQLKLPETHQIHHWKAIKTWKHGLEVFLHNLTRTWTHQIAKQPCFRQNACPSNATHAEVKPHRLVFAFQRTMWITCCKLSGPFTKSQLWSEKSEEWEDLMICQFDVGKKWSGKKNQC